MSSSKLLACTLVIIIIILCGCKGQGSSSKQEGATGSSGSAPGNQNPNEPTLTFSPRIVIKADESGERKPVMELDTVDASGETKTVSVPLEGLDKSTPNLQFSFSASTPVAASPGAK
jgi:hypothetical protein